MELDKRVVVSCTVTIAEVAPEGASLADKRALSKPMTTDIKFVLANSQPETVHDALNSYIHDKWSKKPHRITAIHKITSDNVEVWAEA